MPKNVHYCKKLVLWSAHGTGCQKTQVLALGHLSLFDFVPGSQHSLSIGSQVYTKQEWKSCLCTDHRLLQSRSTQQEMFTLFSDWHLPGIQKHFYSLI